MRFLLPRDPALRTELERKIEAMDDQVAVEFFHEFGKWAELSPTRRMGIVVAILNDRHDICVLDPGGGCPLVIGAYDAQTGDFTLADLSDGDTADARHAVRTCARALAETVRTQVFLA